VVVVVIVVVVVVVVLVVVVAVVGGGSGGGSGGIGGSGSGGGGRLVVCNGGGDGKHLIVLKIWLIKFEIIAIYARLPVSLSRRSAFFPLCLSPQLLSKDFNFLFVNFFSSSKHGTS
jgi:hypothetical protein